MSDADILPIHDAARFLDALGEPPFQFQTFAEPKGTSNRNRLNRVITGTFGAVHKQLATLNASGAAVCVMINQGDGTKGRKADNVTGIRGLFVDLDGAPVEPLYSAPLRPHLIVETSPGNHHGYWRVADCPLSAFRGVQQHLAEMFEGDKTVCDLPRVMRLPGFMHLKYTPFRSRVILCDPSPRYPFADFARAFGLAPGTLTAASDPLTEGGRNSGLFKLAGGLRRQGIDRDDAARRIALVNQSRCIPPLDADEVSAIVANAYTGKLEGFVLLPNALLDSPEYKSLSPAARNFVDLAYRRFQPHAADRLVFTFANYRDYFSKSNFYQLRSEAIRTGLIIETKPNKQPRKDAKPEPAHYRLKYVHSPAGGTINNHE